MVKPSVFTLRRNPVRLRRTRWGLLSCTLGVAVAWAQSPPASGVISFPAEPLADAIQDIARQGNVNILVNPALIAGAQAPAVTDASTQGALDSVLAGTGLGIKYVDEKTITVLPRTSVRMQASNTGAIPPHPKEGKSDSSDSFRLAQVDQAASDAVTPSASPTGAHLEEIVVTAQKRAERLADVPVPVTALSAQTLVDSHELRLQDYYTSVPGLSVTPDDVRGSPLLAIRGITTGGYTNPTVGITVDDVPYGAASSLGGGYSAPDLDPSDLQRIEVLRGPQGTLYGASSIGGLLKYVTVDPSTDAASGRLEADVNHIRNGDGTGYGVRGAVNVPLGDSLAVRASAFARRDAGYIDNVQTGQTGVNWANAAGGRLAALWKLTDGFSLKLSALLQTVSTHGSPDVDVEPGLGDLQQSHLRNTGLFNKQVQAYSATLKGQIAGIDLTSVTGFNINGLSDSIDYTPIFGPFGLAQAQFGVGGTPLVDFNRTNKISEELRLSTRFFERVDWLLGLFYTHESDHIIQQLLAADTTSADVVGRGAAFDWGVTYAEYAAFTDFTLRITDQFDIQLGARESHNRQTYAEEDSGPYIPLLEGLASPVFFPQVDTTENAFTYLVTPRLKLTPDAMIYARLASGYRPGGPNPTATVFGLPAAFGRDKTENYELGVKADVLERLLSIDGSVYYIDWKDVQLQLADPSTGLTYYANGSRAKSQGVELSVQSRPISGLTLSAWSAFNDAKLTKPFPATSAAYGSSGDRLPYSSRFSGNVAADEEFGIGLGGTGFFGATLGYVGQREGVFATVASGSPERQSFPAYAKLDLHAGVRLQGWTVTLFGTNVTDRRGLLTGGIGTSIPIEFNYIQPRTVGLTMTKSF